MVWCIEATQWNFQTKQLVPVHLGLPLEVPLCNLCSTVASVILCHVPSHSVKPWSQHWLIAAGAYPGFCSMKWLGVFILPLVGTLVHHRSLPSNLLGFPQQFAGTHLYSWVERGTVRVKSLVQEHNTMSPARARTQTA